MRHFRCAATEGRAPVSRHLVPPFLASYPSPRRGGWREYYDSGIAHLCRWQLWLVGQYERIEGTFAGEVDPKDPSNADIVDIALAPKNAHGKVTYSADFQILRPLDLSKGNHRVIFELPNRGRTNILGILNDSTTPNDTTK